jgi:hypothetical protein
VGTHEDVRARLGYPAANASTDGEDHWYLGCMQGESHDQLTFTGGFVYSTDRGLSLGRSAHANRPLGRLSLDSSGVEVTFRGLRLFNRAFSAGIGNRIAWSDVERIQAVRGLLPFPGNVGVKFYGTPRLIFWCSPTARDQILQAAKRYAPPTVPVSTEHKFVLPG